MDQLSSEKRLSIIYIFCTVAGAVASITTGIAWGHWKLTLDQCLNNRNCSCILYGEYTPSKFLGGSNSPCIWVTFGPLIYILFTIGMICFHGYRVLFSTHTTRNKTLMARNEAGEVIEVRTVQIEDTDPLPRGFWIAAAVFTVTFTIYALIHFAFFIDGYLTTCNEYRKYLEKSLGLHGSAIPVIHSRLHCQAIFDFMDYVQPDSGVNFRDGFINTGLDLALGVAASFFSWLLFGIAAFINIRMARQKPE